MNHAIQSLVPANAKQVLPVPLVMKHVRKVNLESAVCRSAFAKMKHTAMSNLAHVNVERGGTVLIGKHYLTTNLY